MNQETELIVKAIESLRPVSNIFKDYLFPIVSAFFSSLLGAGVAYFSFKYQEHIKIEKDKINAANKWTLIVEEAFSSLIAIKANYHGKLTDNPIQRVSQIPTILGNSKPIVEELTTLSFVVPKSINKTSSNVKWSQLPQIRVMINNYNRLLELWEKRNQLVGPIKEKVIQKFSNKAFVDVNIDQITECVGITKLVDLIDLTEQAIKRTDDIIVELNDFLLNFPKLAKSLIKKNKLKKYGSILTYMNNENKNLLELIKKSPEVNYSTLSRLFGKSHEEIKRQYQTGYE